MPSLNSDHTRAAVCRTLLAAVDLADLWHPEGPTERAIKLYEDNGGPLGSGARTLLLVAFAIWQMPGGPDHLRFEDLWRLDKGNLHLIGSLLVAMAEGSGAVDKWLEAHEAGK